MNEAQILELMDKLESQNGDDVSWCWMELRRLLEENAAQQMRRADSDDETREDRLSLVPDHWVRAAGK
jgi:hypothetical protein